MGNTSDDDEYPLIQEMANSFFVEEIGDDELEIRIRIPKREESLFLRKLQELRTNMKEIEESRMDFFDTERGKAITFLIRLGTIRGYQRMIADIYFEQSPGISQPVATIDMEKGPDKMQLHVFGNGGGSVRKYSFAIFLAALNQARNLLLGAE